jgi:hypothetical protein
LKPSERIKREFDRLWATNNYSVPNALRTAIGAYLDEQAALEQRRRRVLKALHYLTVFGVEEARHELALAGLRELRLPPSLAAAPFPDRIDAVARILQAAEREGLL